MTDVLSYSDKLQWLTISDFTPGCVSQSKLAQSTNSGGIPSNPTGEVAQEIPTRQPGIADPRGTYGCIALPSGGLAPLPKIVGIVTGTGAFPNTGGLGNPAGAIVGLESYGPMEAYTGPYHYADELHLFTEYTCNVNPGPVMTRSFFWNVIPWYKSGGVWAAILATSYSSPAVLQQGQYWGVMADKTRMAPNAGGPPYYPVIVMEWYGIEEVTAGNPGLVYAWPDPNNTNTLTPYHITQLVGGPLLICHQGRIIVPQTASYGHGPVGIAILNEDICYTDPPLLLTGGGTQQEVFAPEGPSGYGAGFSVNAGELLLIKHVGGALIAAGDLDNPSITHLPSVQSLHGLVNLGCNIRAGFMYLAYKVGAFVWGGGSNSQKISDQLDDNFFDMNYWLEASFFWQNNNPQVAAGQRGGAAAQCEEWSDWVCVSNGWLYDQITSSWWRLTPWLVDSNTSPTFMWYAGGFSGGVMYATRCRFTDPVNDTTIWKMEKGLSATQYQWKGYSFTGGVNRKVKVREIVVEISDPGVTTGTVTLTVTLTGMLAGSEVTESVTISVPAETVNYPFPQKIRTSCYFEAENCAPTIFVEGANNANPAPILHSISFGYEDSVLANAT